MTRIDKLSSKLTFGRATLDDVIELHRRVWRKLDDYLRDSWPDYGWDMPTMNIVFPEYAAILRAISNFGLRCLHG